MKYSVTRGRIVTDYDSVSVVVDHDDVTVIEVDFDSKYALFIGYAYIDGNGIAVLFDIGDHTIRADTTSTTPTSIDVYPDTGTLSDWKISAVVSRYTATIVIWKDTR